ncbi:MAG: aldehyde dehydrogenase family protein [Paenacidovorax caeni]
MFDDADIDSAAEGAFASKYRNAGQYLRMFQPFLRAGGGNEEFVTRFAAKVRTAKVGNGFEPGVNQGLLIEEAALDKASPP